MRSNVLRSLAATLLLVAAVALAAHLLRERIRVGGPAGRERISIDAVNHAPFDALLQKYVDTEGLVAYRRWKDNAADLFALDDYLAELGRADPDAAATSAGRLAFWINAYNALTLKGVLMKYPLTSIKDVVSHTPGGYNVWRDLLLPVGGADYSLDNIEHDVLRKLGEPRIHFAIVCAAKGCPPLRHRAYTTAGLDEQLADNARRFFARSINYRADARRVIHLSQLLQWYGTDFAPNPVEQVRQVRMYFPAADPPAWLDGDDFDVEFDLKYDWALNDQAP